LMEAAGVPVTAIGSKTLDLTSPEAGEGLAALLRPDDAVVMAAGLTPDKGRDIATLMKNLRMAENVCAAVTRTAPAHFVYISSDGVYDARFSSLLNEDSTCEPTDLYNLMHIARERMLGQTCRTSSVPFAVVRPCSIYGPGDTHNSYGPNRFVRTARKDGKITLFGGGEERRHHVFFEDAAKIVMLCVLHCSSGIINAITGEAASFREVADMIISAGGHEVALECLPRATPVTHRHFDVTGLAQAFPDFSATTLAAGIARTVAQS
jgi:UDP-glucose 4-epimerase